MLSYLVPSDTKGYTQGSQNPYNPMQQISSDANHQTHYANGGAAHIFQPQLPSLPNGKPNDLKLENCSTDTSKLLSNETPEKSQTSDLKYNGKITVSRKIVIENYDEEGGMENQLHKMNRTETPRGRTEECSMHVIYEDEVSDPCSDAEILTPLSDEKSIVKSSKPGLKRVSFGSSKGSMVETLIYDTSNDENNLDLPPASDPIAQKLQLETGEPHKAASRVRVSFFESEKPLPVTSPESPDLTSFSSFIDEMTSSPHSNAADALDRQISLDNGRDNPFRPDGDISKEADEIVRLIKSGVPLDVSRLSQPNGNATDGSPRHSNDTVEPLINSYETQTRLKSDINGASSEPGQVEVQHATVSPSDPAQVEHIVLKKKKKCCVIQ